ncbi:MBL fold metallo-hydrolase [Frigidibacter sp. MR17.24]|uniref:MBL fold metallo-hydrolase n=1 Tax=Frigidibacter sp. MR17.24 TaxID=3127345 RepID=UPI003012AAB5
MRPIPIAVSLILSLVPLPVAAQVQFPTPAPEAPAAPGRIPSHCVALARNTPGAAVIRRAAFGDALADDTVRLSYVRHATYAIETAGGLLAATDYTGTLGPADPVPDVVTMNNAHSSHWTARPDPRIAHVLQGWVADGEVPEHALDLGEMLVRNVSTDTRDWSGGTRPNGNSIFVFEAAGLCIGHLGHLHHEPTPQQYALLGRMDVVMAPVDGGYTMDTETMTRVLGRLRASLILPMHWFGEATLERFLDGLSASEFAVSRPGTSSVEVSLTSLPARPTVMVLEPEWLD